MTEMQVAPERQRRVAKSLKFYSFAAFFTGIWLLILVIEMIFKYLIIGQENFPSWLAFIGPAHGIVFMV